MIKKIQILAEALLYANDILRAYLLLERMIYDTFPDRSYFRYCRCADTFIRIVDKVAHHTSKFHFDRLRRCGHVLEDTLLIRLSALDSRFRSSIYRLSEIAESFQKRGSCSARASDNHASERHGNSTKPDSP